MKDIVYNLGNQLTKKQKKSVKYSKNDEYHFCETDWIIIHAIFGLFWVFGLWFYFWGIQYL